MVTRFLTTISLCGRAQSDNHRHGRISVVNRPESIFPRSAEYGGSSTVIPAQSPRQKPTFLLDVVIFGLAIILL